VFSDGLSAMVFYLPPKSVASLRLPYEKNTPVYPRPVVSLIATEWFLRVASTDVYPSSTIFIYDGR